MRPYEIFRINIGNKLSKQLQIYSDVYIIPKDMHCSTVYLVS